MKHRIQIRQRIDVEHHELGTVNQAADRFKRGRQQELRLIVDHAVLRLSNVNLRPSVIDFNHFGCGVRILVLIGICLYIGAFRTAKDDLIPGFNP